MKNLIAYPCSYELQHFAKLLARWGLTFEVNEEDYLMTDENGNVRWGHSHIIVQVPEDETLFVNALYDVAREKASASIFIYDEYKSVHGIRPRWMNFDEMAIHEVHALAEQLSAELKRQFEEEQAEMLEWEHRRFMTDEELAAEEAAEWSRKLRQYQEEHPAPANTPFAALLGGAV